ncbi:hypothetical protein [uncultured Clostridium sp.]|uniref:hypothetical protein n=1 Tax=uncultured Clostridium sp. TaxID=59620 RepID=UPI0026EB3E61|nr:hypothetical protein [uncultured Clostridium sp.]
MTASAIFTKFADKNGLVSIKDLMKVGWTKSMAEDEGIIIKEDFYDYNMDGRRTEGKKVK